MQPAHNKFAGNRFRKVVPGVVAALLLMSVFATGVAFAQDPAAPAGPTVEERIADLEAYINNTAPAKLTGVAGPGHNGWMMTSAALVLFMTLPGLALFYGGLVRRKNIL